MSCDSRIYTVSENGQMVLDFKRSEQILGADILQLSFLCVVTILISILVDEVIDTTDDEKYLL
jgi:hypothetical protein